MGMRCKKHPYQAGGGVCATCLRDRLLVLAAERNGGDSSPPAPPAPAPAPEPAAAFPRSVSPYISRRKSDAAAALRNHPTLLFFRTPQVGPAGAGGALEEGDIAYECQKRRAGRFSVLATLFGHRHHGSEEETAKERKKHSWLAGIIPRRRKKHASSSPPSAPPRRSHRAVSNRGLSPEPGSHGSGEESSSPAAADVPVADAEDPVPPPPGQQHAVRIRRLPQPARAAQPGATPPPRPAAGPRRRLLLRAPPVAAPQPRPRHALPIQEARRRRTLPVIHYFRFHPMISPPT